MDEGRPISSIRFYEFFEALGEGFAHHQVLCDAEGAPVDYRFLGVNSAFEEITGLKRVSILGCTVKEVLPGIADEWIQTYGRVALTGEPVAFESFEDTLDKWFKVVAFAPKRGEFCTLFVDITDLRRLGSPELRYRMLLEGSNDIILFLDDTGRIADFNQAAVAAYGYEPEELRGMNVRLLRSTEARAAFDKDFQSALLYGTVFETTHQRKNGTVFPVEISSRSTELNTGVFLMSIIRDITKRKRMEAELKYRAEYDWMTDVHNRRYFLDAFGPMADTAELSGCRMALHLISINNFKSINDMFGHEAGDLVLKEVAARLKECTRQVDQLARWSGDEFVLLQTRIHEDMDLQLMTERIAKAMEEPVRVLSEVLSVAYSVGISVFPEDSKDRDTLIRRADAAMYAAKRSGRKGFSYYRETP